MGIRNIVTSFQRFIVSFQTYPEICFQYPMINILTMKLTYQQTKNKQTKKQQQKKRNKKRWLKQLPKVIFYMFTNITNIMVLDHLNWTNITDHWFKPKSLTTEREADHS